MKRVGILEKIDSNGKSRFTPVHKNIFGKWTSIRYINSK